jgi:hypothetical protein
MSFLSKLVKTAIDTASIPVAVIKDVATMGGVANDGFFRDGGGTYTGKKLRQIGEDIEEAKDEL